MNLACCSMKNAEYLRAKAHDLIKDLPEPESEDPIESLNALPLRTPHCMHERQEIAQFNVDLDSRGPLGRRAQAGAYVEEHFPEYNVVFAEILHSALSDERIIVAKNIASNRPLA